MKSFGSDTTTTTTIQYNRERQVIQMITPLNELCAIERERTNHQASSIRDTNARKNSIGNKIRIVFWRNYHTNLYIFFFHSRIIQQC